jgi:hypothetical protein
MKFSSIYLAAGLLFSETATCSPVLERRLLSGGGPGPNIQFPESFGKTGGAWFANPFQVFMNMVTGKGIGKSIEDSAQFVQFPGIPGGGNMNAGGNNGGNNGGQQGQGQGQQQPQQQQQSQPQQQQSGNSSGGGHQH